VSPARRSPVLVHPFPSTALSGCFSIDVLPKLHVSWNWSFAPCPPPPRPRAIPGCGPRSVPDLNNRVDKTTLIFLGLFSIRPACFVFFFSSPPDRISFSSKVLPAGSLHRAKRALVVSLFFSFFQSSIPVNSCPRVNGALLFSTRSTRVRFRKHPLSYTRSSPVPNFFFCVPDCLDFFLFLLFFPAADGRLVFAF